MFEILFLFFFRNIKSTSILCYSSQIKHENTTLFVISIHSIYIVYSHLLTFNDFIFVNFHVKPVTKT